MAIFPIRTFGDPVLRVRAEQVREVDQTVRHPRAILALHVPFFVFEHLHHALEFLEALHDETRSMRAANFLDQLPHPGDQFRFVDAGALRAHLVDDALEISQILVSELEGDVHRHRFHHYLLVTEQRIVRQPLQSTDSRHTILSILQLFFCWYFSCPNTRH